MVEEIQIQQEQQKNKTPAPSPFNESNWSEEEPVVAQPEKVTDTNNEPVVDSNKPAGDNNIQTPDYNSFVKEKFGYETVDELSARLATAKELEEKGVNATPEFKFENDLSKKLFTALKEGKTEDAYKYLHQNNELGRLSNLTVDGVKPASEILKAELQYKYQEQGLTSEEITDLFNEKYEFPEKPIRDEDQDDEEYSVDIKKWESKCDTINKRIIRDAKLAKSELAKLHSNLVLPDISSSAAQTEKQSTPEELAEQKAKYEQAKQIFSKSVETGLNTFNGFNVTVKDENGELPVSFGVTAEDKTSMKPIVESLYDSFDYFGKRWGNADGSFNTALMAQDLFLLENQGKILQKIANEASSLTLVKHLKQQSNIDLNGKNVPRGTNDAERLAKEHQRAEVKAIFAG